MKPKYYPPIVTKNGRIALLTMKDFNNAVEEGKSILLFGMNSKMSLFLITALIMIK